MICHEEQLIADACSQIVRHHHTEADDDKAQYYWGIESDAPSFFHKYLQLIL